MKPRGSPGTVESSPDDWWQRLPYSGEFSGIERCPGNPFPRGSEWGDELDYRYKTRLRRRFFRAPDTTV